MRRPGATVHVRIGRLQVDRAALGGLRPADFAARLGEALAGRAGAAATGEPHPVGDRVAEAVSARLAASGGPFKVGGRHGQD